MRSLLLAAALALLCRGAGAEPWRDYQIIQWQARNPAQLATLKRIGVTAGAVIADREGTGTPLPVQTAPLREAGLRWYIENIATDFYSAYHRWTPGKPVNWRFTPLQQRYRADPTDNTVFLRDPSLCDPVWQARIRARLIDTVRQQFRYHPLYYNLGDETGIADLSAFWDFDLSPVSLAGMRAWLRTQYSSLAALNAEWGTEFATWNDVAPETTRHAMRRTDGNFAAWADFKAWMDESFARALRLGTDAVHAADPHALAGIEGAQVPGWGGYDYTLLAHAVDLMEGDDGDALPIVRSLDPNMIALTTSFTADPAGVHEIWRELLRGTRGLALWDKDASIVHPDGKLGERGEIYAPVFAELHRIAPLIINATPQYDSVSILYSPASFRTQWMLDQQPKGDAWIERDAETELEDNPFRVSLRNYMQSLAQLGVAPSFVSAPMLPRLHTHVLLLPDSLALSPADANAIAAFAAHGGTVIADVPPGSYDAHSRRQAQPVIAHGIVHLVPPTDHALLASVLQTAGVAPMFRFQAPGNDIEMHLFHHDHGTIVALQRSKPADSEEDVLLNLPRPMSVTDLLTEHKLGKAQHLTITVGPVTPTLLYAVP